MIEVEKQGVATIIRVKEPQLQMYVIPQFKSAISEVLDGQPAHVIFDLEGVDHLDSSAMGAIFHFQRRIREYKGKLGIIHVSSKIMQVFKITKSDGHLDVFESLEAALKG
jgi:anti-sigma B factor antagonist